MPVDRLLPSDDATRADRADPRHGRQGARPDRRRAREVRDVSRRGLRPAGRRGPAEPAAARGVGRRRPALRGVPAGARGDRRALGRGRGGGQRAQPVVAPAADVRHRRAEAALVARHALRRADRRLQPVRTAGRFRRRGAAVRGGADGDGYVLNGSKAWITHGGIADFYTLFARTGERSDQLLPGARQTSTGVSFGKPEEKMGLHAVPTTSAFYDDARIDADRLHRRRGSGPADRLQRIGFRPAGHRRGRDRHRAGRPRRGHRIRQRAHDVRPQDHRPSGARLPAGGHGRRGRQRAGDLPRRRPPQGRRTALLAAGQRRQAGRAPTPR